MEHDTLEPEYQLERLRDEGGDIYIKTTTLFCCSKMGLEHGVPTSEGSVE